MEGSPIPKEGQLSSLLSEDLATISLAGYMSRAFSPNYRPNESDVIDLRMASAKFVHIGVTTENGKNSTPSVMVRG